MPNNDSYSEIDIPVVLSRNLAVCDIVSGFAGAMPTLSVPCGFSEDRLPIALQLVGKPFNEETLLRIGYTYQQNTDWHTQRPPI